MVMFIIYCEELLVASLQPTLHFYVIHDYCNDCNAFTHNDCHVHPYLDRIILVSLTWCKREKSMLSASESDVVDMHKPSEI